MARYGRLRSSRADVRLYACHGVFREIVAPERIVFDHVSGLEEGGKTRLVFRMLFETAAECAKVKGFPSRLAART
jgi:hypothetical protein